MFKSINRASQPRHRGQRKAIVSSATVAIIALILFVAFKNEQPPASSRVDSSLNRAQPHLGTGIEGSDDRSSLGQLNENPTATVLAQIEQRPLEQKHPGAVRTFAMNGDDYLTARPGFSPASDPNVSARSFSGRGETESDGKEIDTDRLDQPDEGLTFRLLQLRDENGKIPADGPQKARQHMDMMRASQIAKARASGKDPNREEVAGIEPGAWAWLGPGNVGGRIRSIVIDPNNANNLLVGSVSGGIWRSTDTGNSWQPVDDFMANLAVSTMVRNPNNANIIYAGTGEGFAANLNSDGLGFSPDGTRGLGVFQSTDGGNTWTQLASTNPGTPAICAAAGGACPWSFVNRLAISPDASTILAGTASGIWRSTDAGVSWTQGAGFGGVVFDIDFDPSNSQLAVAGGSAGAAAFSTDGGVNWTQAITGLGGRVELAYAPSNPSIVYASVDQNQGDVYRSSDGGQTYSQVNTGNNLLARQGNYGNIIWVNPQDPTFVIVGGVVLWRSTDSGTNFTQISTGTQNADSAHPDHHMIVASAGFNNASDKSVYFANDGGIHRADDVSTVSQTNGWTHRNNNLGITQFYGGAVSANGTIFGGTQDNGSVKVVPTPNIIPPYDPQTWSTIVGGDGGYVAADPADANFLYSEYTYLAIQRSTDGGGSARYIYCNPEMTVPAGVCTGTGILDAFNGANFISPFILDPNDPNTMLAGGLSLWRSNDIKAAGLPTWTVAKTPNPTIPPPPPPPAPTPTPAQNPISAIAVANGNSDFIVVGHNDGQIFLSQNGTNSSPNWTSITPPVIPPPNFARFVTRLAIDISKSPNWIYATLGGFSDGNVIRTEDLGATWTDVSGNGTTSLPNVPVRSIVINPAVSENLYVGTEVGIFASEDAGATWQLPQGGPANVSVDELFWFQGDLVAATHGRGIYKTHVPVVDTTKCSVDIGLSCRGTTCPTGQVACAGSGCSCCNIGDWQCPCAWSAQRVPTENDDAYVACPMTGSGGARNITISAGGGVTFNGSGSLRAFGDLVNFGFIRVTNPFGASQIAADGDILNYRPRPAVTNAGVIEIPGSITAGGTVTNYGIIAVNKL